MLLLVAMENKQLILYYSKPTVECSEHHRRGESCEVGS